MLAQKPDTGLLITVYFNLGTLYSKKGNIDKGYNYYLLSKEYAEKHNLDNHAFSFMSQQNLGVLCRMRGEFSEAFQYAYTAKNAADTSCNPEQLSMVFALLSNLHMETDNIDSAYFYLAKHNAIQQELIMNSKTTEVYKDYISIYLESAQKELTIAEQEIIIRNRRFVLMAVLVVATILVVVLLLIMMRQKKHSMGKRIEQEKQIQGLQKEKIEMQVRELTSYSVLLSNKNHSFQQISELVRQLPSSETKEVGEIKKKLADIIKTDLNTESERNNFMLHFEQVHPRFFEKLKERSNELTEHNLHLCAYFRIGMSSKQIAQILNVSFDTIRINRYRLRKKLRLSEDEDLYDFLRNL
jgi:ATP-dependent transcriptional regulator